MFGKNKYNNHNTIEAREMSGEGDRREEVQALFSE